MKLHLAVIYIATHHIYLCQYIQELCCPTNIKKINKDLQLQGSAFLQKETLSGKVLD